MDETIQNIGGLVMQINHAPKSKRADTSRNMQSVTNTRVSLRNKTVNDSIENKKMENPTSLREKKKKTVLENGQSDQGIKRKAALVLDDKQQTKMSKTDSSSENDFTPRRSSRGAKPNRKFKDMEVDFTPGKKQNNTAEKNPEKESVTPKSQKKVKRNVTPQSKSKKSNLKDKNDECKIITLSCEETDDKVDETDDKVDEGKSSIDIDETKIDNEASDYIVETISEISNESENADIPSIKVIRFDENDDMQISDLHQKDKADSLFETINDQSESPDFSIIQEEDLERITSELLELAQNAEMENNQVQEIFTKEISEQENKQLVTKTPGDNQEPVALPSGITVTDIKIVELVQNSENQTQTDSSSESIKQTKVIDEGNTVDTNIELFDDKSKVSVNQQNPILELHETTTNTETTMSEKYPVKGPEREVMVENIMGTKAKTNEEIPTETNQSVEEEGTNLDPDEFTKAEVIPFSFMDTDIQDAVKNALMELTNKAVDGDESVEHTFETDTSPKKEKTEGVSSATQTSNIIKLPALNPKSRIGPMVKSITLNVQQPDETNESGDKVKPGKSMKQEFIIVHVPDGQVVKRTHVKVSKPEDLIPYETDKDGQLRCGMCDYVTHKRVNMYKHRKKHVDDRSHCCPYCKYKTTTSSNLKRHIGIHQDVRNFRCHLCDTTFRQKIHLERHIRYRHEEKSVKCPLCDYVCANENPDLKVHMKRRHLPQDGEDGTYQAFKCNECGMMTVNKKDFKQHMKFHSKTGPELKLFCDHCSFVTDCESRLKRHSYIHSKEKPFKCGMCEYRASQKEHVIRHMRTQHGVEIEKRNRKYDDEDSLTESIDSKDDSTEQKPSSDQNKGDKYDYTSQEKIFACNHCSMKFSKLLNLYKHLHAQHKEILPDAENNEYLCVVCDFKTTTKKNLLVHMRKHNQLDQIPPSHVYSCVLCNYINPKRRNLFQHMKKKHGIEVVMKDDGSTSCFVADGSVIASKCDETVQNILTIGDIVTTETEEQELQIVTDELDKDGIQVQNVISFDDLAYAVSHPQPHNRNLIVMDPNNSLIKQHEAAEAIEGLQALAEQPGIVTSSEIIAEVNPEFITAGEIDNDKNETETEIVTVEMTEDIPTVKEEKTESENGIQMSADELMHLSAGDYVEINGEMYKVEISDDTGIRTESVTTTDSL